MPGEGSIWKRKDGKWVAALSFGSRTDRSFKRRIRDTYREARAALAELQADERDRVNPSKLSLGEYLRRWLDETARPAISANTYRGYEDALAHLAPIAGIRIVDVTAEDLESVFNRMTTRRGKVAKPAAPKTVRNVQIMLRRAFAQAVDRGHVARNVARQVPLRRVPRRRRPAMTPELAQQILEAVAGDRYEAAYALAFVGLREGEILGLARDDVDLDAGTALVWYELIGSGAKAVRHQVKTEASEATVPLPPFVVERLRLHFARQDEERPVRPLDGGLVFTTPAGYPVNGSWLTKHFQKLLANAKLPRLRLHDLRHGTASLLVGAGVHPRIAQELLRHADSRTTMEIYAHVSGGQQRDAVEVLDRLVGVTPRDTRQMSLWGSEVAQNGAE